MTRPISALRSRVLTVAAWCLPLLLAACATVPGPPPSRLAPTQVRAEILRHLPADAQDRTGWATDIQTAFSTQRIDPNPENICAVLAVIAQESGTTPTRAYPTCRALRARRSTGAPPRTIYRNCWSMPH